MTRSSGFRFSPSPKSMRSIDRIFASRSLPPRHRPPTIKTTTTTTATATGAGAIQTNSKHISGSGYNKLDSNGQVVSYVPTARRHSSSLFKYTTTTSSPPPPSSSPSSSSYLCFHSSSSFDFTSPLSPSLETDYASDAIEFHDLLM